LASFIWRRRLTLSWNFWERRRSNAARTISMLTACKPASCPRLWPAKSSVLKPFGCRGSPCWDASGRSEPTPGLHTAGCRTLTLLAVSTSAGAVIGSVLTLRLACTASCRTVTSHLRVQMLTRKLKGSGGELKCHSSQYRPCMNAHLS
jgi:hypothetical protein